MLQPLVRRTWAPRGQTPLLRQWERHDRLSVASGLTVAPCRRRLGLYWRMQPKNIRAVDLVHFLRSLRRHLRRPLVLILDRWSVHKAAAMGAYLRRHRRHLQVEWLPSYAPELNPTEQVWNHVKYAELPNATPDDLEALAGSVGGSLLRQRGQSQLLRSFFQTARLRL